MSWFFIYHDGDRPYTTPASTAEWMGIQPTEVSIYKLHTTQPKISVWDVYKAFRGVPSSWCSDKLPHVVFHEGQYWVSDGHHRIMAARLKLKRKLVVRLFGE